MHHVVDNSLLHRNQYGSIPGRESITPVLITEMQNEIARVTRKPMISSDYDSSSCYDRIIENLASLVARGYGQHHLICKLHAQHLFHAKYWLKTQLGISKRFYKHTKNSAVYGTGQGSSASPSLWCLLCCRLFEAHESYAHGAIFKSPDEKLVLKTSMVGFVDDCYSSLNQWDDPSASIDDLLKKAQFDAQLWSNLLNSTGGALEVPKVKFHIIQFQFQPSGKPIMSTPLPHQRIEIDAKDGDGMQEMIPLDPSTARKMLGCHKEPTGSNNKALSAIRKNAIHKATKIFNSNLNFRCVFRYYYSMFLPSVLYSFPTNSIPTTKLNKLDSQTI